MCDRRRAHIVTGCLSNAILAGVRIGVAEALAQATEQGSDVDLHLDVKTAPIDEIGNDPG